MRLQIRHVTRFNYRGQVRDNLNQLRLCPCEDSHQTLESFTLLSTPVAESTTSWDEHRNLVHDLAILAPHSQLKIEAISVVATTESAGKKDAALPDRPGTCDRGEKMQEFLEPSPLVSLGKDLMVQSRAALPQGRTQHGRDAEIIGQYTHRLLAYTPNATAVDTPMTDALRKRQGVCQDFSHVMIALCRVHGIPARYVSGYCQPPSGSSALQTTSPHAWVEVYLPHEGWKGYDPTYECAPGPRYVKIAVGRDYADVPPIAGTFCGRGTQSMRTSVEILELNVS